jgi:hypothetical protein
MSRATPPLLPEQRLAKVLGIARANSLGVIVCAAASLSLNVLEPDWVRAGFAALALVAGAMEWHGQNQLRDRDVGGLHWLLGAQGCLYTVIAGYAMWRLQHFDAAAYWAEFPEEVRESFNTRMRESNLDPVADREFMLRGMNFLVCTVLIVVSTIYQGGLAWWYRRQRFAVAEALASS